MTNAPDLQAPYKTYFARFQGEHTGIAAFYCTSTESLIAASRSEQAFAYPLLHSELPTISYKGNRENIITWFQAPLFILLQPESPDSTDIDAAFEKARRIANHIVLKLLSDHIDKEDDAAALEFSIDSVSMEPVRCLWSDHALGYELSLKVGFYTSTCLNED